MSFVSRLRIGAAVAAVLAAIACIVTALPADATTLQPLTVADMTRHAVAVVAGEVVETRAEETPSGVRTMVRLHVTRTFKGIGPRFMTVYVPGGVLPDGRQVLVSGMPSFRVGETSVVFVDVRGWVVGGMQGGLEVSKGKVAATGQTLDALGRAVKSAVARPGAAGSAEQVAAESPTSPVPGSAGGRAVSGVVITEITPPSAPAGTGSVVTISGSGFGATPGRVSFSYGRKGVTRIAADSVRSWSDTSIKCVVPIGLIDDYAASAGTGPVVVATAQGQESNGFSFEVPFGYGAARWDTPVVTYRVNTAGVDDALRTGLLGAAAAVWNAASSRLTLVDGGPTGAGATPDGLSVISWADGLPYGVLAMTYSDRSAGVISEADVQFSSAYAWGEGTPGSATYDIQSIAAHEMGHWLVLLDQYMVGDADKIMYGYGGEGEQKRTPASGDVAGIQWIYPGASPSPTPTPTPTLSPTATASPSPTPSPTALDVGPVCRARSAAVRRGTIATLIYMVTDDLDLVVTRSISITTTAGVVKKKWTGIAKSSPAWQSFRFRCDLKRGSYRLTVRATDLAGHPASVVGRATLTVK